MTINIFENQNLIALRQNWMRLLILGIGLIILGVVALINSMITTVITMYFLGWVLILTGLIEAMQAIHFYKNGRFFLHLMNTILSIVIGVMLLIHPITGTLVITLLFAMYFCVMGAFRIVMVLTIKTPNSRWTIADGVICLVLGSLVWAQWPTSALWLIGYFIGINLVFSGCSQVMLALAIHSDKPNLV